MDCFAVICVLMRKRLIDPQFQIPRGSVFATAFRFSGRWNTDYPNESQRKLAPIRNTLLTFHILALAF